MIGYLPILIGIVVSFFTEQAPSVLQVVIGLVCSAVLGAFSLKIVENLCKSKNTPYGYTWGDGYFAKYMSM
jgi:urea transporter